MPLYALLLLFFYASEQAVIIEEPIFDQVKKKMIANGCYFVNKEEAAKLTAGAIIADKCAVNPSMPTYLMTLSTRRQQIEEPEKSRNIKFNEVFAIRANSPNADAAWAFIKYVNGEDFAKVKSKSLNNGLMSRMGYSKEFEGVSLDVFYKLQPKLEGAVSKDMSKIPQSFYPQYQPIVDREMKLVQDNKKSMDEALQTIEQEGQVILDKAIKDEASKESGK